MKNLVGKLVLLLCIAVVGCSSQNTRQENTTLGAVSGAVVGGLTGSLVGGGTGKAVAIGAGIVGGALIGGMIGHSMDSSDNSKMNMAMNDNAPNQTTTWTNSKSGSTYSITPTSGTMSYQGHTMCRKFYTTAIVNGKKTKNYGVACRGSDGVWKTVQSS